MSRLTFRRVVAGLPELEPAQWARFGGEDAATREVCRAHALGFAQTVEDAWWLATVWDDGGSVRGIALAVVEEHPGRRLLVVNARYPFGTVAPGLWLAEGEDVEEVTTALLRLLAARAPELGAQMVVLARCPIADERLSRATQGLGMISLEAPPDWRLELPPGATVSSYLEGLSSRRRRDFRRLRQRAAEAEVELRELHPPPPEVLDEAWPLHLELLARWKALDRPNGQNLFRALAAGLPAERVSLLGAFERGALTGYVLFHRLGPQRTYLAYSGHVPEPPVQMYATLVTRCIELELERGARTLVFNETEDTFKSGLGCVPVARATRFLRVR